MKLPTGVVAGLDAAINRYLALDPDARARMAQLDVQCIALHLRGLDLTLYALPEARGLKISDQFDGTPDAVISGTPLGLAQLGAGLQRERALFSGDVEITGRVESGQAFQSILEDMDIDWEEQLSHLTGDVIAHQIGKVMRSAGSYLQQGRATVRQNTTEYLQEELRVLPARIEIENFCADVARLAMDSDRLEARTRRLQQRTSTADERS